MPPSLVGIAWERGYTGTSNGFMFQPSMFTADSLRHTAVPTITDSYSIKTLGWASMYNFSSTVQGDEECLGTS